jgi:hypothetical protein
VFRWRKQGSMLNAIFLASFLPSFAKNYAISRWPMLWSCFLHT